MISTKYSDIQDNDELWYQWNLTDHTRAVDDGSYNLEMTIYSPTVAYLNSSPPNLILHKTINSIQWRNEEECSLNARIGDIIHVRDVTPKSNSEFSITYALERVDTLYRWNRYCVYHSPSERFSDVIKEQK